MASSSFARRLHFSSKQAFRTVYHRFSSSSNCSSSLLHHPPFSFFDPFTYIASDHSLIHRHRRIVLLGPPGVGKGTYGRLLSAKLGLPHISTGDLIRAELNKPASHEWNAMNKGQLLGDDVVLRLLWERLMMEEGSRDSGQGGGGYILDGVPRTATQAVMLEEAGVQVDVALNLRVAEEEAMVAKCLGRRVCRECGQDYNLANVVCPPHLFLPARLPPPICASNLCVREDDASETVVRERLTVYHRSMAAVENHYKRQKKLVTIDVGKGAEWSWPKIMEAVSREQQASPLKSASI